MVQIMTSLISTTLIMCLAFAVSELHALLCDRAMFDNGVHNYCLPIYKELMADINYQDECPWPNTLRYYYNLNYCVDYVVNLTACTDQFLKDKIFLDLHSTYFLHCSFLKNPDVPILLLLTLPGVIITFLFSFCCSYITTQEDRVYD